VRGGGKRITKKGVEGERTWMMGDRANQAVVAGTKSRGEQQLWLLKRVVQGSDSSERAVVTGLTAIHDFSRNANVNGFEI